MKIKIEEMHDIEEEKDYFIRKLQIINLLLN